MRVAFVLHVADSTCVWGADLLMVTASWPHGVPAWGHGKKPPPHICALATP